MALADLIDVPALWRRHKARAVAKLTYRRRCDVCTRTVAPSRFDVWSAGVLARWSAGVSPARPRSFNTEFISPGWPDIVVARRSSTRCVADHGATKCLEGKRVLIFTSAYERWSLRLNPTGGLNDFSPQSRYHDRPQRPFNLLGHWIHSLIRLIKTDRVPSTVWDLVAAAIAVVIALKLHARYAAYLLGAIIAVMAAETGVALYYGHSALQGAATHFAVLAAGVIGVALGGWLVARYPISRPAQT